MIWPGRNGFGMRNEPPATVSPARSYQNSSTVNPASALVEVFWTRKVVTISFRCRRETGCR